MGLAPAAPEAGLSIGLILLAIACLFLLALNKVYKFTLGALLDTLAGMFHSLSFHVPVINKSIGLGFIGDALKAVDNYVLQAIGVGIQETEKGLHAVLGAMTWLLQETADQIAGLAQDTFHGFKYVKGYLIPALLGAALAPLIRQIEHLGHQTKTIILHPTTIVHKTVQVLTPGLKAIEGKVSTLEAKVAALATAGVAANPVPIIERVVTRPAAIPQDIYRGIDSLWKDVKRIGKVVTPVGIAGLVAGALLATLKMPWLKCRNVDKVGRALCHTHTNVLEGLLTGLVALFGTFSLVAFAHYLLPIADEVGGEVTHFWRADVAKQGGDRQLGNPALD